MSSQRGNVSRSRAQRHQNSSAFKNDKFDSSARTKKLNTKVHDAVCQRCKDVLEWRIKYKKFKTLTQPKKCVKCLEKTVKDAYHIICRACAGKLELCAKCGNKEEIVISVDKGSENNDDLASQEKKDEGADDLDFAGENDDGGDGGGDDDDDDDDDDDGGGDDGGKD